MRTLLIALLLWPVASLAEVYKWVDEDGTVHYTDKPPAQSATPAELPPLQTYDGNNIPKLSSSAGSAASAGRDAAADGPVSLTITSPTADATIRGDQRTVPVSISASGNTEGLRYVFYLDGTPQALPSPSTSFVLKDVERGSHTVGVSAFDESGNETATAPTVTIHMKPPTAR